MRLFRPGILLLLLSGPFFASAQNPGFDSFIDRIAEQYKVDVAIAPELIPVLDSIRHVGSEITSVQELLSRLLNQSGITYQLIDGNKLMLRRENIADSNQVIAFLVGTVIDEQSKEPLPFATLFAHASNTACHTDDAGQFILPLKDTTGQITIQYLGYKPINISVREALRKPLSISMEVDKIPLEEVVLIVPYKLIDQDYTNQSTDLEGYQFISGDQLLKWNAERLITTLTLYTHFSADHGIRIRGTSAENSLIMMEDIPVYDPYHFYNIFGPFNGLYFSSVEVYKNNLPIEYGGRVDGMIHVQSHREHPDNKLILDADLLQTGLTTEIVLSPHAYLTAGGRLSHTSILNEALSDSTAANFSLRGRLKDENEWTAVQQPTTDFYDINLGLVAKAGKTNTLDFHFFDSYDKLDLMSLTSLESFIFNQEIFSVQQVYTSEEVWKNRGYSAGLESVLHPTTTLHLTAFHSRFDRDVSFTSMFEEVRQGETTIRNNKGFQESSLVSSGIKGFVQQQAGMKSSITAGLDYQHHEVDFGAQENNSPYLSQVQKEVESSLFGELTHQFGARLNGSGGMRLTHLQSTEQWYSLPSIRLLYQVDTRWSIRSAFSKNLQTVREVTLEDRFGQELDFQLLSEPEKGIPVLQSDKYMIGAGYSTTFLSVDAEVYYKNVNGLARVRPLKPDPSFGNQAPGDFYRLFTGDGYTYGIDLTLLYKKKNFEVSVFYTLSKMQERYGPLFNGQYFSPQEDRRHQVKVSGIYNFGRFRALTLLTYKSGSPYLSLIRLSEGDGIGMTTYKAVKRFLPAYFSLDLGLDYSFTLFQHQALVGISLINATNHENISDLRHLGRISREGGRQLFITSQTELLGRTANVHFRYLID